MPTFGRFPRQPAGWAVCGTAKFCVENITFVLVFHSPIQTEIYEIQSNIKTIYAFLSSFSRTILIKNTRRLVFEMVEARRVELLSIKCTNPISSTYLSSVQSTSGELLSVFPVCQSLVKPAFRLSSGGALIRPLLLSGCHPHSINRR